VGFGSCEIVQKEMLTDGTRNRAEVPLGNSVQPDLLEERRAKATQDTVLRFCIDEIAEASHGVVPQAGFGVFNDDFF